MDKPQPKEWTLMFYLASDNPLAPSIVSQLKAIKQAGFHPEANVIAQFDPYTEGTPTHIFDVNLINKLKNHGAPNIGFVSNDPYVRNLIEDKLWRNQKDRFGKDRIRDQIKRTLAAKGITYDPPMPPEDRSASGHGATPGYLQELDPKTSLGNFLKFCSDNYPARHYILFLLGHGVIVGNDIFLYDEHAAEHSLKLKELGEVLTTFKQDIEKQDAEFELVSFHSCSVSSLEVAYELQGTANYMLASQSPAFVGSWPYRQILIRVFNSLLKDGSAIDIKDMLIRIFYYCLYNSADFLLAGYSFDLSLCNLNEVSAIKDPLEELSTALVYGLNDPSVRDLILLSHWKAQSYWQESYTDLYDFCFCLSRNCTDFMAMAGPATGTLRTIKRACGGVMEALMKERGGEDGRIIVRSEYAGPAYQYSHGLSVFFPWVKPSADSQVMEEYRGYKFEETSWISFLERYFAKTMRDTHRKEDRYDRRAAPPRRSNDEDELLEDITSLVYNEEGQLSEDSALNHKVNALDPTGDECTCGAIKNYPHDTRARREKERQAAQRRAPVSQTFFDEFQGWSE